MKAFYYWFVLENWDYSYWPVDRLAATGPAERVGLNSCCIQVETGSLWCCCQPRRLCWAFPSVFMGCSKWRQFGGLTVIIGVIYWFKWISKYVLWWEDRKTEGFCDEPQQVTMSHFLTWPLPALVHHKHTLGNKPTMHLSNCRKLRRKEATEDLISVSVKKPIGPFDPRLLRTQCSEHLNFLSWIRFLTLSKYFHIFPNKADFPTGKSPQTVSLKQHHSCEQTGQRAVKSGPSTTNTAVHWD